MTKQTGRTIFDDRDPTISYDGIRVWINDTGQYHRYPGPAVLHNNGTKEWWVDGKLHRLDGPAIEDGVRGNWYTHGNDITKEVEEWRRENNIKLPLNDEAKTMFKLKWG